MIPISTLLRSIFPKLRRGATNSPPAFGHDLPAEDAPLPDSGEIPGSADGKIVFGGHRDAESLRPRATPVVMRRTKNNRSYAIVGTVGELRGLLENPPPASTYIVFSGSLVLMADQAEDIAPADNYHRQTDRIVKPLGNLTLAKRNNHFALKVWLHEDAVALKRALPRHRCCFALDQYLAHGRARAEPHLHLITGHVADEDTILHIFTFDDGALTAINERVLASSSHIRFQADYANLLASYDRNDYTVIVADPLPQPPAHMDSGNLRYLDGQIYDKLISFYIIDDAAEPSFMARHGISMTAGIISLVLYVASMALPYDSYHDSTESFRRIAAIIPQNDLAFGSDQLKAMSERRLFLNEERPQHDTVPFLRRLTSALAANGSDVIVSSLALNQIKVQPTDPDINIVVEMKKSPDPNLTALAQAKPILDRLSERMGVDFRLSHNAFQERIGPNNSKTLSFNIEGEFKRKGN